MANTSCGRVGRGGNARFHTFQLVLTDRRTNGPMDRLTDGPTDKGSYRVVCLHSKMWQTDGTTDGPTRHGVDRVVCDWKWKPFVNCALWIAKIRPNLAENSEGFLGYWIRGWKDRQIYGSSSLYYLGNQHIGPLPKKCLGSTKRPMGRLT